MARIIVLPESVANRIAAGEVVERPAAALKELIENALDARARSIEILLEGGGRDAITVSDDGEGMGPDDLLLALERHATSKIRSDVDIEEVRTLGFRGEAVPSIASVSRFRMTSRDGSSEVATVVEVHGGRLIGVREQPERRGTRVEVLGLFYNAPARRKFLRTPETERQKCIETVSRLALGYPEVRFRLTSDRRVLFDHAPVADPVARCTQVLGGQLAQGLVPIDVSSGELHLTGLASGVSETRAHSRDQHLYVNRRPVRDRLLSHAVSAAYADALPRGRFPVLVLLLDLPPSQVDVNVHPSKSEVRFRRSTQIHGFVQESLHDALRGAGAYPVLATGASTGGPGTRNDRAVTTPQGSASEGGNGLAAAQGGSSAASPQEVLDGEQGQEPRLPGSGGFTYSPLAIPAMPGRLGSSQEAEPWRFSEDGPSARTLVPGAPSHELGTVVQTHSVETPSVVPLGQFLDSYILARDRDGLLIIDQHVAHERVLFEQILRIARETAVPATQRLLSPRPVGLSAAEREALLGATEPLSSTGFEFDEFGGDTILLRGIPVGFEGTDPERLLREILSDLRVGDRPAPPEERQRKVAASAACHAAIKVHFPLTVTKMAWLLGELFRCETPTTCPHGRPIVLRIGRDEIERGFHRR